MVNLNAENAGILQRQGFIWAIQTEYKKITQREEGESTTE